MLFRAALPLLLAALAAAVPAKLPPAAAPAPAPAQAASSDGKLPADILCSVYGGSYCKGVPQQAQPTRSKRQEPVDPDQCAIFGGPSCQGQAAEGGSEPARNPRQDQDAGTVPADLDPNQICSIFGGPTCPPSDQNKVYDPCLCPSGQGEGCECVPYYQCDNDTGSFNTDGKGVIDIRQKQDREEFDASAPNSTCSHYLQQCCRIRSGSGPSSEAPWPTPDPYPTPDTYPTPDPIPSPKPVPGPHPVTQPKCGVRHGGGIGKRISGAMHDEADFGEIPWMVAILKKRQAEHDYMCGGGLIAPNVVLTAAHCVDGKSASSMKIRAGEWDSRTELEAYRHQDRDVEAIVQHPDYVPQSLHNDVALLILREPVKVGFHIGTICLPDQDQNFDYKSCLVSGWGKNVFGKEGVYQNILRRIDDLPVVPHAQCQEKLRRTRVGPYFKLNKSFMCAGGVKGKDACTGDGGSPLVCPMTDSADSRYLFAGIVAWGVGCGQEDVPGVYADVAQFRGWIESEMASREIPLCRADD